MFGAMIDEGFSAARPGFVWDKTAGKGLGCHAMVLVGYEDRRNAYKVLNSWGTGWGDGGYGWVAYGHFSRVATEAYVAKDARNAAGPAVVDTPVTPTPTVIAPVRNPADGVEFSLTSVQHNTMIPNQPQAGYFMRFDGAMVIPSGVGRIDQAVVSFWYDAGGGVKGMPVTSLMPAYATVYGQAACGTAQYPIPPEGLRTGWGAWIPYTALGVPAGAYVPGPTGWIYQPRTTALIAEAQLFVDNFGIKISPPVLFTVTK